MTTTASLLLLASAATPGPWKARTEIGHPGVVAVARPNAFDWICSMQVSNSPRFAADAAYIAAASPDVVLALCERIEALEAFEARHGCTLENIEAPNMAWFDVAAVERVKAVKDARIEALEAGLAEALAGWAREWGQHEHHGGPVVVPHRMMELRKLVTP